MLEIKTVLGKHYIIELNECNPDRIEKVSTVKEIFLQAARLSKATILDYFFHQFQPVGVSGVILIAESHFTIHTWPEKKYAGIDIFTCGDMNVEIAIETMQQGFQPTNTNVQKLLRGSYETDKSQQLPIYSHLSDNNDTGKLQYYL